MKAVLSQPRSAERVEFTNPSLVQSMLASPAWAWLWLVVRLYVGYQWLHAGLGKLQSPAWTQTGLALKGYWEKAVAVPAAPAKAPITYEWYRTFLEALLQGGHYTWFAKLVVAGEVLIGIALILGIFTGIAAVFGGLMNWNFMMAGTASTNPVLFTLAILLVLAWRVAGWWGLDRWILPALGTPWLPGQVFGRRVGFEGRKPSRTQA